MRVASWLNWPTPLFDGDIEEFLRQKRIDFAGRTAEFAKKYDEYRVDWKCRIVEAIDAGQFYLVQPSSEPTNQRIAVYPRDKDDFKLSMADETKVRRVRAQVDRIGVSQIILKQAKVD